MSNALEKKKLIAEQARVMAARLDMEVKIEELEQALARVNNDIQIQKKREAELADKISKLEE